ncbi:hypothetical protein BJP36_36340 [Moorena producens JHB]|uniref:Uncharacterized protein n=1 Tax=Moorena producens (strain JHB) TaxID=1454205 RepID=A0A9Q9UW60_MOOP1|nr:hypothetical protein [Moorena producens]WAN69560.1 hypothetical protein BJP36_36340 [Moorena producens JHB]
MGYRYIGTDIDGPRFNPEQLYVHSRNLNDLVGNFSFSGTIYPDCLTHLRKWQSSRGAVLRGNTSKPDSVVVMLPDPVYNKPYPSPELEMYWWCGV